MITGTKNGIRTVSRGRPLIKYHPGIGWRAHGRAGHHGWKLAAAISFARSKNKAAAKGD